VHQPLHASDDNDRGGNDKRASAAGFRPANLHRFCDTEFIDPLGSNTKAIAPDLIGHISKTQEQRGRPVISPIEESFGVAKNDAYGQLPDPNSRGSFRLRQGSLRRAPHPDRSAPRLGLRFAVGNEDTDVRLSVS
jgi:hypothetical protein